METHFRDPTDITAVNVMTSPAIACREEMRLEEVAEVLGDHRISGLVVVDANDRLVGMISERDIAHALGGPLMRLAVRRPAREGDADRRFAIEGARVASDVMSSPVVIGRPDTSVRALAHEMAEKQINRIPIVDDERLIGVVTRGDVLKGVGGIELHPTPVKDPVILGSGIAGSTVSPRDH